MLHVTSYNIDYFHGTHRLTMENSPLPNTSFTSYKFRKLKRCRYHGHDIKLRKYYKLEIFDLKKKKKIGCSSTSKNK